jgi:hypothetical protein
LGQVSTKVGVARVEGDITRHSHLYQVGQKRNRVEDTT